MQCLKCLPSNAPDRHKNDDCGTEDVLDEDWFGGRSGVLAMMLRKLLDVGESKLGGRFPAREMSHGAVWVGTEVGVMGETYPREVWPPERTYQNRVLVLMRINITPALGPSIALSTSGLYYALKSG